MSCYVNDICAGSVQSGSMLGLNLSVPDVDMDEFAQALHI